MNERLLSVDEIAAHLGVNPDTIYKWITRKSMPRAQTRAALEVFGLGGQPVGENWSGRKGIDLCVDTEGFCNEEE